MGISLRSALFFLFFTLWTGIWALCLLPFVILPRSFQVWGARTWARVSVGLLEICCGIRVQIRGSEALPQGPCVIVANHQSSLETLLLWRIFPRLSFVLKHELLRLPIIGWYLPFSWPIAVDRGAGRQALRQLLEAGAERLAAGYPVLIFPEGTRQDCGTLGAFHGTAVALAQRAGVPLVPLALNSGCFWPRGDWRKYPGTVHLHFGDARTPEGAPRTVTEELRTWIATELAQMPAPARPRR